MEATYQNQASTSQLRGPLNTEMMAVLRMRGKMLALTVAQFVTI